MTRKVQIKVKNLFNRLRSLFYFLFFGHKFKEIGKLCKVYGDGIHIGHNVTVGDFCWIESVMNYKAYGGTQSFSPIITIGNSVSISDFVHISSVKRITIDDGVLIGSKVYIGDHSHGSTSRHDWVSFSNIPPRDRPISDISSIYIGKNCWIGDNVVILAGASIGNNCVVAANSVVKCLFPDNTIIAGVPAKVIREML